MQQRQQVFSTVGMHVRNVALLPPCLLKPLVKDMVHTDVCLFKSVFIYLSIFGCAGSWLLGWLFLEL